MNEVEEALEALDWLLANRDLHKTIVLTNESLERRDMLQELCNPKYEKSHITKFQRGKK